MGACLSSDKGKYEGQNVPGVIKVPSAIGGVDPPSGGGSDSPGDTIRAGGSYFAFKGGNGQPAEDKVPVANLAQKMFPMTEAEIGLLTYSGRIVDCSVEENLQARGGMSGSMYTKQGMKGTNQDSCLLWGAFSGPDGLEGVEPAVIAGVFDGHGANGHVVSEVVRDVLPVMLARERARAATSDSVSSLVEGSPQRGGEEARDEEGALSDWAGASKSAFVKVDSVLVEKCGDVRVPPPAGQDFRWSGTTASVAIIEGGRSVTLMNLGDSRAMVITEDPSAKDGCTVAVATEDHKPGDPVERTRAEAAGACVRTIPEEPHRLRIWPPDVADALDGKCPLSAPGVAMSRAFGDGVLKGCGLFNEPTCTHIQLDASRRHVVLLASDGIWDVDSCASYAKVAFGAFGSGGNIAQLVTEHALGRWKSRFPRSTVDDIGVVVVCVDREGEEGPIVKTGAVDVKF